jgi:hypothetical protein
MKNLNTKEKELLEQCATKDVVNSEILPDVAQIFNSKSKDNLWPNRIIQAVAEKKVVPFIGAGVSAAADIKMWRQLLSEMKLPEGLLDAMPYDSLTPAEIAKLRTGSTRVQNTLRNSVFNKKTTVTHVFMAMLKCPIYMTTNYDKLIEKSIQIASGDLKMEVPVIANDSDLQELFSELPDDKKSLHAYSDANNPIIIKIHGCASRQNEYLVFTRSDYRTHYRTNVEFFKQIRELLSRRHILFCGFSHTDPEVSRLLEDSLFLYEHRVAEAQNSQAMKDALSDGPFFYNMELKENKHLYDIFPAQGIMPIVIPELPKSMEPEDGSALSIRVASSVGRLAVAKPIKNALDKIVRCHASELAQSLAHALEIICDRDVVEEVLRILHSAETDPKNVFGDKLCDSIFYKLQTELSSQGVWLLDKEGYVVGCGLPQDHDKEARLQYIRILAELPVNELARFVNRPYFRVAQSFREVFISDGIRSIFNGHNTIFICRPIIGERDVFKGLLFSATQPGHWSTPWNIAKRVFREHGQKFVLCCSDGVPLVPFALNESSQVPNMDRHELPNMVRNAEENKSGKAKVDKANLGFNYTKLERAGLQSKLVQQVKHLIIPSLQADTEFVVGNEEYDIVTQFVPRTPWKLAIARPKRPARKTKKTKKTKKNQQQKN